MLYRSPSGEFALVQSAGSSPGKLTQAALEADDHPMVAELKRRGVTFEDVDLPGLSASDRVAQVQANYPSNGGKGGNVPPGFATAKGPTRLRTATGLNELALAAI